MEGLTCSIAGLRLRNGRTGITCPLQEKLEEAAEYIPPYLFRTFSNQSGGSFRGLNTTEGVTPHGFLRDPPCPDDPYDLGDDELKRLVLDHLSNRFTGKSPFSSWSATILLCLGYARWMEHAGHAGIHIAVLNTAQMGESFRAWHSPRMLLALGKDRGCDPEWIVYGPVLGDAYRAVPYSRMQRAGILGLLPELGWEFGPKDYHWPSWPKRYRAHSFPPDTGNYEYDNYADESEDDDSDYHGSGRAESETGDEFGDDDSEDGDNLGQAGPNYGKEGHEEVEFTELCKRSMSLINAIAKLFKPMQFGVAAQLACLETRPWHGVPFEDSDSFSAGKNVRIFLDGLTNVKIDSDWDNEKWLLNNDKAYGGGYPELDRWVALMRAVKIAVHGDGS